MHSFVSLVFLVSSFACLLLPPFSLLCIWFTDYLFRGKVVVSEINHGLLSSFFSLSVFFFFFAFLISHSSSQSFSNCIGLNEVNRNGSMGK